MTEKTTESSTVKELAGELAVAIAGLQPKRRATIADIKPVTPFNPTGSRSRKLERHVFINGRHQNKMLHNLHDEEIKLLNSNRLKPGKYIRYEGVVGSEMVTITERDLGTEGVALRISWDQSKDGRMKLKGECKNLVAILKRCLDEAAEQSRKPAA